MHLINLIPWRTQRLKKIIFLGLLANLLCWNLCLLGYLSYKHYLNMASKHQMIVQLEQQIASLNSQRARLKPMLQAKQATEKMRQLNRNLLESLVQLSQMMPDTIRLESINLTTTDISLEGIASNQSDIALFPQSAFNLTYFNKQRSWAISEHRPDIHFKLVLIHEKEVNQSI